MKCYRIRHKPTGLYFCPSREIKCKLGNYVKSNLSARGKIYHSKPSLKWLDKGGIYSHIHIKEVEGYTGTRGKNVLLPFFEFEWEIEEV